MPGTVEFAIVRGDITSFDADVIVLKYAQAFHGADKVVATQLRPEGPRARDLRPAIGEYRLVETEGAIQARYALFVGVAPLRDFRYEQIQEFSVRGLNILSNEMPDAQHIAMTIHGANTGLDEVEALLAQVKGCVEALQTGRIPAELERISIVEHNQNRAQRLWQALDQYLAKSGSVTRIADQWAYRLPAQISQAERKERRMPAVAKSSAEEATPTLSASREKPHAFIAMPFKDEMDDVFYYGIQNPVHTAGLLCERVDKSAFTGDIMGYVRQRIETASVVIAELTGANPNVYLEVGYAWGKERPTILLVQSEQELEFDVRGHKCLTYRKIKDLEQSLIKELQGMISADIVKL